MSPPGPRRPHSLKQSPRAFQRPLLGERARADPGVPSATTLVGLVARLWSLEPTRLLALSTLFTVSSPTVIRSLEPRPVPLLLCTTLHGALTLMGATRDGCFLGKTSVRTTTSVPLAQKACPTIGQLGARIRLPASGLPHGLAGTAGLVPGGPPCLWCCHLSWVCLRPSACWTCSPLAHLSPCFHAPHTLLCCTALHSIRCPFSAILGSLWARLVSLLLPQGGITVAVEMEGVLAKSISLSVPSPSRPIPWVLLKRPGRGMTTQQCPPVPR